MITDFASCGVSYWNPTREGILEAIDKCKINAEERNGKQGKETRLHHEEIMKFVNKLPPD